MNKCSYEVDVMIDVLTRAGCFIAIIIAGYILRRVNFFKEGDFAVLSKITLKITLPAAFISNFSGKQLDPSMLFITLMALGCGIIYMILGYVINLGKSKDDKAFGVLNLPGYLFYNLPLELEARTALMILAFSPIGSAVPAFTEEMGGDAGLSAALNSISIICSIVFMLTILVIML